MPIDSNIERQTLALLLSLQDWLSKSRKVWVTIDNLGWSSARIGPGRWRSPCRS